MSSENEKDKNSIKKVVKSSIGSDGIYYGEIGESQELQELKTPRQLNKKENPAKKFEPKSKERTLIHQDREETEDESVREDNVFDEDGNIIKEESDLNIKIAELKESIALKLAELKQLLREKLEEPLNKLKTILLKISGAFLGTFGRVFSLFNTIFLKIFRISKEEITDTTRSDEKEAYQKEPTVTPEEKYITAGFNEMARLNVFFTDNYDIGLYKKKKASSPDFSKIEEEIMMLNAIDAIKQCSEFTANVPAPAEGYYEGIAVSRIMEEVSPADVSLFLGYVKARPQKYTSKTWKISETFATWLVNNSPMAEKK